MSIARNLTAPVNPSHSPTAGPSASAISATLATLRAAARDAQVSRGALAVLLWFASESNGWRRFTVTGRASAELRSLTKELGLSKNTVFEALKVLRDNGHLEERKPRKARPGEREARLSLSSSASGATAR